MLRTNYLGGWVKRMFNVDNKVLSCTNEAPKKKQFNS